jgi:hypothetical protein
VSGPCRRWRPAPVTDEGRAREQVVTILADRFPRTERVVIARMVDEAWQELGAARVRDFVPVLVTREVAERLEEAQGPPPAG